LFSDGIWDRETASEKSYILKEEQKKAKTVAKKGLNHKADLLDRLDLKAE